jgi:hypothetical protein
MDGFRLLAHGDHRACFSDSSLVTSRFAKGQTGRLRMFADISAIAESTMRSDRLFHGRFPENCGWPVRCCLSKVTRTLAVVPRTAKEVIASGHCFEFDQANAAQGIETLRLFNQRLLRRMSA